MRILPLFLLFLILSCAQKVETSCPNREDILREFSSRYVPKDFRIYGTLYYGPLRLPMMLAKFDGFYTVRVAKARNVSIERDRLCIERRCYLLPAPPENLVFGKVLSGREVSLCEGGRLIFEESLGVYRKRVLFEGRRLKELILWNVRKNRGMRILFGKEDGRGFFREIDFDMEPGRVKLQIEEVEI